MREPRSSIQGSTRSTDLATLMDMATLHWMDIGQARAVPIPSQSPDSPAELSSIHTEAVSIPRPGQVRRETGSTAGPSAGYVVLTSNDRNQLMSAAPQRLAGASTR